MKTLRLLPALLAFVLLSSALSAQSIDYKSLPQWKWHKQDSTEYYLYTPDGMEPGKRYPAVLFLHGCCGESYEATPRKTIDPGVRMWHNFAENTQQIPTFIVAPATSRGWNQHRENLKKVLDELIASGKADPQRIYIAGFSMGGRGTLDFVNAYPDFFAAALPMGMGFSGSKELAADLPIWINIGELDNYGKGLPGAVDTIRRLNGYEGGWNEWETGVNPRFTMFRGVGHGVQWDAASSQDLVGWAYSKINDGNKYPTVFFHTPAHRQEVNMGQSVSYSVTATDKDGSIAQVAIYLNGKLQATHTAPPFSGAVRITAPGDYRLEAIATDDRGKTSTAAILVGTRLPLALVPALPAGRQGVGYRHQLSAAGNGPITYQATGSWPAGLLVSPTGLISGVPQVAGAFSPKVQLTDRNGQTTEVTLALRLKAKDKKQVVVTNARTADGTACPVTIFGKGSVPFFDAPTEVNAHHTAGFDGMLLIQTRQADSKSTEASALTFETDQPATLYVAYERFENLFQSTTPEWLNGFEKVEGRQIACQYRYYDVYKKSIPKGRHTLPGADAPGNKVNTNYFVLVGR